MSVPMLYTVTVHLDIHATDAGQAKRIALDMLKPLADDDALFDFTLDSEAVQLDQ